MVKKRSNKIARRSLGKPAIFMIAFAVIGVAALILAQAQTVPPLVKSGSFSLSPNSGSYEQNGNFTVGVYVDSGTEPINTVQADLAYDATKLQFVSVDAANSAFDASAQNTGGNGQISIARAKLGSSVSGRQFVANVTFKMLAASGSSTVTFRNTSAIVRVVDYQDMWNGVLTGGTYTTRTLKPGDVNRDDAINALDLSILASNYGLTGRTRAQGDLNGDSVVNAVDFSIVAANWGK